MACVNALPRTPGDARLPQSGHMQGLSRLRRQRGALGFAALGATSVACTVQPSQYLTYATTVCTTVLGSHAGMPCNAKEVTKVIDQVSRISGVRNQSTANVLCIHYQIVMAESEPLLMLPLRKC